MAPKLKADISVTKKQAGRFLLAHHRLLQPRKLRGKQGILDYIEHVGCIQYDPINLVGQNPHLVLQARVANYKPAMLDELLYKDRTLIDGWDKLASIYATKDWPYFQRMRERTANRHKADFKKGGKLQVRDKIRAAIAERGPLSSIDIEHDEKLTAWGWGQDMNAVRAAMDIMYFAGELGVARRVGTRRVFDLTENLLPAKLLKAKDPHPYDNDYADWHVLRRIGSMGFASPTGAERWYGMTGVAGKERQAAIGRLHAAGKILRVEVNEFAKVAFYVRKGDLPALKAAAKPPKGKRGAALLAPLDNAMWDRNLLELLFDFYYRWEVYVPEAKRQYAYYVLPVIYGDEFVARLDPAFDKASGAFTINNWWWQTNVDKKDDEMLPALTDCIRDFAKYLNAKTVKLGDKVKKDALLKKLVSSL
jgi:uncharacterized protein YcaQ